ncbi:phosphatase PAP2 family protein [candidate division WWE3 bacterium]|nr:phosphatase PAP2 family protein [candidate division WWE3 bacterium]
MTLTFQDYIALLFGEVLIIIQFLVVAFVGLQHDRRVFWRSLLSFMLTTAVVYMIKFLIPVSRPYVDLHTNLLPGVSVGINDSFPSAHAAWAFTLAATVWDDRHKLGGIMLFLALCVAIGRVLLLVHSPIDVIVGAFIGIICAIGVGFFYSEKS